MVCLARGCGSQSCRYANTYDSHLLRDHFERVLDFPWYSQWESGPKARFLEVPQPQVGIPCVSLLCAPRIEWGIESFRGPIVTLGNRKHFCCVAEVIPPL